MEHVEVDLVKGVKAIEELKVDLVKAQYLFQRGTLTGSETEMLQGLAELVGTSYLLTRRLGFDFSRLDRLLLQQLEAWRSGNKHELENNWGDLSLLLSYLAPEE